MRILLLVACLLVLVVGRLSADEVWLLPREVVAEGVASILGDPVAAEEEAIWDAKRNAVEQAVGQSIHSKAVGRDFAMEGTDIWSRADGFIERWEMVPGSRHEENLNGSPVLMVKIRAWVAPSTVVHKLTDMSDVYHDLERPRVRIKITGDSAGQQLEEALTAALRKQGIEIATDDQAEIALLGELEITHTVSLSDDSGPFHLGGSVSVCRSRLAMRAVSRASEEVLFCQESQGRGNSFLSDAESARNAARDVTSTLLADSDHAFIPTLLRYWVQEREDGYVAAVGVHGFSPAERSAFVQYLREQRGFRRLLDERMVDGDLQVRFLTGLDMRDLRRRLAAYHDTKGKLSVLTDRGPIVRCAMLPRERSSAP